MLGIKTHGGALQGTCLRSVVVQSPGRVKCKRPSNEFVCVYATMDDVISLEEAQTSESAYCLNFNGSLFKSRHLYVVQLLDGAQDSLPLLGVAMQSCY